MRAAGSVSAEASRGDPATIARIPHGSRDVFPDVLVKNEPADPLSDVAFHKLLWYGLTRTRDTGVSRSSSEGGGTWLD